jgi:hypothetical protein
MPQTMLYWMLKVLHELHAMSAGHCLRLVHYL